MPRFLLLFLTVFALSPWAHAWAAEAAPAPAAASAPASSPYTVSGIEVDIKGMAASKARDKAFVEGANKAFDTLAARLGAAEKVSAKKLGDAAVQALIRSFEVEKEKSASARYIATLTFHFKPDATQGLFTSRGVEINEDPYAASPAAAPDEKKDVKAGADPVKADHAPYLVLPMLRANERAVLWEEQTPWHRAWLNYLSDHPHPDIRVAEGGMDDVRTLSASEALAGLKAPLVKIMQHYEAKGVIVPVLVSPTTAPASTQDLAVQITRYDAQGLVQGTYTMPLTAQAQRKSIEWLQDGVGAALALVRDGIANPSGASVSGQLPAATVPATAPSAAPPSATANANAPTILLTLKVPFTYPEDWPNARQALQRIPEITQNTTLRMTRDQANLRISYKGARQQLEKQLGDLGFQLVEPPVPDGTLVLLPNGHPPADPAGAQPQFHIIYAPQTPPGAGTASPATAPAPGAPAAGPAAGEENSDPAGDTAGDTDSLDGDMQ